MQIRAVEGFNRSVSIERGPLVYALRIGENWSKLRQRGPVTDWEVFPSSPWNYGLRVNPANPAAAFAVQEEPIAKQPINAAHPPVLLKVKALRLPAWTIVEDSAAPPPQSPVVIPAKEDMVIRPINEIVTLIPYGAARLRITSFPVLK